MKRVLSVILALAMVFMLGGCSASDYKAAVKSMEAGDYAAAAESFRALADYKDSAALAQECDYLLAVDWKDGGDFAGASAAFKAMNGYKDSAALAQECDYELAVALFESGDYTGAIAAFEALGDYADSADYAVRAADQLLAEKLVGNWSHTMAMEEMVAAFAELDGLELPPLEMVVLLDVDEELGYRLYIDEEKTSRNFEAFIDGFGDTLLDMLRSELAPYGLTLEDALPQLGVSSEEELKKMLLDESGLTVEALMQEMPATETGTLDVSDGVIQLTGGEDVYAASYNEAEDSFVLTENISLSGFDMEYVFNFTRK